MGDILVSGVPTVASPNAELLDKPVAELIGMARRNVAAVSAITLGGPEASTKAGQLQAARAAQLLQDTSMIMQALLHGLARTNVADHVRGQVMDAALQFAGASTGVAMFAAAASEPIPMRTFLREALEGASAVFASIPTRR